MCTFTIQGAESSFSPKKPKQKSENIGEQIHLDRQTIQRNEWIRIVVSQTAHEGDDPENDLQDSYFN